MTRPAYPDTPRTGPVEALHGRPVPDPYRWLEDSADPRTQTWSDAQDALYDGQLQDLPGREHLRTRLTDLLGAGAVGAPSWRGERQFFMRRTAEQEHAVLLTVDPGSKTERVLLDPMVLDPSGTTTLDGWQPSKEGDLLAHQFSAGGTEESELSILDVATGERVEGPIDRTRYTPVAWLPGGEAFYYVRRLAPDLVPAGEEQYHRRVWLHRLGSDPEQDVLVFGAGQDKTNYYGVSVSMDGRWLTISASAGTAPRNDLWLADLSTSEPEAPRLVIVQQDVDASTSLHVGRDGRVYVFTDRDAPRGRLAVCSPQAPAYDGWTDLVPEDDEAVLEGYAVLDGTELTNPVLLCAWTRHAISEVTVHDLATGDRAGAVPLPGLGTVAGLSERPEGGHEVWIGYTDHVTPSAVYRYDAMTGQSTLWASAPGTVEVPEVHARQIAYPSSDGTTVRMVVLAPATDPDRPRPAVLYGYGGFGVPLTPGFSAGVLAWVEAGGIYAVANLRGGSEEGEQWHRDGMRQHKHHVFEDFHASAERLIADGWTSPSQLSISGGSNGGLLVGAALTQRPELYAAVVCSAPLLDMVRYERFGLGQTWSDEYGSADDPTELDWLLSYSPYHHVSDGIDYPATLFTVFDSDTRVDPMHARKMCAALQHATIGDRPVLLRREKNVGHGARALSRTIALSVEMLAFSARWTGLDLPEAGAGGA